MSWVEDIERRSRALEAERLRAHAYVRAVAAAEDAGLVVGEPGSIAEEDSAGAGKAGDGPVERSLAYRSAVADVAASARLSEQSVQQRIEKAVELTTQYAQVVTALEAGEVAPQHAGVIAEAGRIIGIPGSADTSEISQRRAVYERLVLEKARTVSPNQLRPYARRIAERYALESIDDRHAREQRHRRVWLETAGDGMALLCAYLPVDRAQAIYTRLTRMAQATAQAEAAAARAAREDAQKQGTEPPVVRPRGVGEVRADLLADFLGIDFTTEDGAQIVADAAAQAESTAAGNVQGIVQVIVHADDLDPGLDPGLDPDLGLGPGLDTDMARDPDTEASSGPGARPQSTLQPELEGCGPIPADMARRIAGAATSWTEVTVNPGTGDIRKVESRVPSADQKRKLQVRDAHCRWPGCRMPGFRCDIDHTVAVQDGGETAMTNLGYLCRNHHLVKHHGGWRVVQLPDATYEWTSPTARKTRTVAESRVRFVETGEPPPF
ncbi:HNH endonuclease [Leucobacter sp. gxy201]|uniref:HNH endonuclease signature motif containing protein n=1 Tax=Leucobacter sp. gxy201 TaxID=2957200 RepID=UPI003DA107C6